MLCDFVDWVAHYTLTPPGLVLAMALRAREAFEPETMRTAYVRGARLPKRLTPARTRVLDIAEDGLARSVSAFAEDANVTPAVVRGLIEAGALVETRIAGICAISRTRSRTRASRRSTTNRPWRRMRCSPQVKARHFSVSLLDGVTGSGKTETYFEAVAEALRAGQADADPVCPKSR